MLATLQSRPKLPTAGQLAKLGHALIVLPVGEDLPKACPEGKLLAAALARKGKQVASLKNAPVIANGPNGALRAWIMVDPQGEPFARLAQLRLGLQLLLAEGPSGLDVLLVGFEDDVEGMADMVAYVALANGSPLPSLKREETARPLAELTLWGVAGAPESAEVLAEANLLARLLTALPGNALTPGAYRERLAELADDLGWEREEFGLDRLRELGAGAFLAVARGSAEADAALVRVSHVPADPVARVALVGKGICFDSGGHQLKSAKGMMGMHEDMAGSATALGLLLAATRLNLPVRIDAWLALSRNDLSASAYRPGDVVVAANGTSIEVVHTDAEGRLVLADALALAVRDEPDLVMDFATLTGSLVVALGHRYGGVFANDDALLGLAVEVGRASGERLCAFPLADDYRPGLDSQVADIKQCCLENEADHILAALFLQEFVAGRPWVHVDMAAATCPGGLGAIGTDQTGFGVLWGLKFLANWLAARNSSRPEADGDA